MKTEEFEKLTKTALDQRANRLNSNTLQQLRHARGKALQTREKHSKRSWFMGAGAGLVAASILVFVISSGVFQRHTLSPLEDLDILTADTDLDVILDYDFYEWLDQSAIKSVINNGT